MFLFHLTMILPRSLFVLSLSDIGKSDSGVIEGAIC